MHTCARTQNISNTPCTFKTSTTTQTHAYTNRRAYFCYDGLKTPLLADDVFEEQVSEIRKSLKGWDEEFADELEKCIQELPSMDASAV